MSVLEQLTSVMITKSSVISDRDFDLNNVHIHVADNNPLGLDSLNIA